MRIALCLLASALMLHVTSNSPQGPASVAAGQEPAGIGFVDIHEAIDSCQEAIASQAAKPIVIHGSKTPELIPIFPAWEMFISTLDQSYQYDVLDSYLAERVKLSEIKGYQTYRESVVAVVADFASGSQGELTRIKNKQDDLQELRVRGLLTPSELSDRHLSNVSEQVEFLTRSCDTLRDTLIRLDEEVGSAIWNQLVVFCETHVREGMLFTSDETAEDLAVRAIWTRFDPKLISIQRKKIPLRS